MSHAPSLNDPLSRLFPEFLEEITGNEALDWVRERNARTETFLDSPQTDRGAQPAGHNHPLPTLNQLENQILEVLDDPGRIPAVAVRGDYAYNFWTDGDNPRGLWRRQLFTTYLEGSDEWDVLLDVDALSKAEGKSWVWRGAQMLYPDYKRALITLSDGGSDASETREWDVTKKQWLKDGFLRPQAKGSLNWIDLDHCWLTQPMGPDSTSPSGYPLEARVLRRGQALEDSALIYSAKPHDMAVFAGQSRGPHGTRQLIVVREDFYTQDTYLIDGGAKEALSAKPVAIPAPRSSEVTPWGEWALVWLRDPWERPEASESWTAGTLLALPLTEFFDDPHSTRATPLFSPTENEVLEALTATANTVVLTTIRDVVSRVAVLTPPSESSTDPESTGQENVPSTDGSQEWARLELTPPSTTSPYLTTSVGAVTPLEDDRLWVVTSGYTQPSTLWLVDPGKQVEDPDDQWMLVRQAPVLFDAEGVRVTQHFAVSQDGTRIPYFQVAKERGSLPKAPRPALLYGYGGFDVSLLPSYNAITGLAWIEKGGVFVVANIRGGGEYGPQWHKAALRENRHRAYQDFVAVARDLVARGVTTPAQLGAQGGSNGGLLMGNMYTQYPEDFGAILCQVPLLDMGRFHTLLAGSSWVAEYGNPEDPADWEFIRTFSPVHLFDPEVDYPPLMLTTSTKDDRVHPAHARALGYLAEAANKPVLYFENIEGGHAGAADNRQRAHNLALGWEFLWRALAGPGALDEEHEVAY